MESNYESSESNYEYGEYFGRSYGRFPSESDFSSESHNTYVPTSSFSNESALESRSSFCSSESRGISTIPTKTQSSKKYNSLDDVDKLIEKLEFSMEGANLTSDRANQILAQRKQKIDELKKLVAEARKAEEEERMIKQLEQENRELDDSIDSLNKGFYR